ncbi:hypothetical protein D3C73_1476650 [compost metagenome]
MTPFPEELANCSTYNAQSLIAASNPCSLAYLSKDCSTLGVVIKRGLFITSQILNTLCLLSALSPMVTGTGIIPPNKQAQNISINGSFSPI